MNIEQIKIPATLKKRDTVDIVAPAARCDASVFTHLERFLQDEWELKVRIPNNIFSNDILSANNTQVRFTQLADALTNPTSKMIWCLRGGYGASKLIPHLAKLPPPKSAKIFVGFSDITALHIFLQQEWQWVTVHGPSAHQAAFGKVNANSLARLRSLIFSEQKIDTHTGLVPLNDIASSTQKISAKLIGGNLTLIQTSLGTPWQINCRNKILFIEEVNERGYRIDRILEQLKQANIFDDLSAMIIGDCLGGYEANGHSLVDMVIRDFATNASFPVFSLEGVGHGHTNNPLIFGAPIELIGGKNPSINQQL